MKICGKCKVEKPLDGFPKDKRGRLGVHSSCKECSKAYQASYRNQNKAKIVEDNKKWWEANKESESLKKKQRRLDNLEQARQKNKEYYYENRNDILTRRKELNKVRCAESKRKERDNKNRYEAMRMATDPLYAISKRTRRLVSKRLNERGVRKNSKTAEILGCSFAELKSHLESQFASGMTWQNRSDWHIDHIIPLASAKTPEEIIRLNHYTNLQPLWAADNIRKGAKILKQGE